MEKCEFAQKEINFLGIFLVKTKFECPTKVQAVVEWLAPRSIIDLRFFLGLANFYWKFIAGFSKRVVALTDLMKNDTKWVWSD